MDPTLSAQQRRAWRFHNGRPGAPYGSSLVARVDGPLDAERLRAALAGAWSEEPSSAAAVSSPSGIVAPAGPVACVHVEPPPASGGDADGPLAHGRLLEWLSRDVERRRAGAASWTPLASLLCPASEGTTLWALASSALVADPAALRIIAERAFAIYTDSGAARRGPSLTYAAYVEWQREFGDEAAARGAAAYWARQRSQDGEPRLPGWKGNERPDEPKPARLWRLVAEPLAGELERAAAAAGGDLRLLLLAAWQTLLWRHLGGPSIELGVLVDGRAHPALLGVRGPCARYLPVRVDIAHVSSLSHLVALLDATMREHELWQDGFPHESGGVHPLAFDWFDLRGRAGGLRLEHVHAALEPCHVRLATARTDAGVSCVLEWDDARYEERDMAWLADRYLALVRVCVSRLDVSPADVEIVDRAESGRLVAHGDGGGDPRPAPPSVLSLFNRQVKSRPAHPAVIAGGSHLGYGEVDRRARQLAAQLVAAGVIPGTRVAVLLPRSTDAIVSFLAVLKAGGAFVPLDPAQPPERLRQMIVDSRSCALVTYDDCSRELAPVDCPILRLDVDRPDWGALVRRLPGPPDPAQPAYVIYTSGSTGRPKGVVISHRNLVHSTAARRTYYRHPARRYLVLSPLAFDSAMAGIFWTLCYGGTLVLPGDDEHADPAALRRLIQSLAVTHVLCLPSLYGWLLEDDAAAAELRSLQVAIVAGEACPPAVAARHHRVLPAVELHNEYGPTECTVWSTVHEIAARDEPARVPIGRPIPHARIYVADRPWRLAPWGVVGEALIGGKGVADGYLARPALTAGRFTPDPWSDRPGARLYRTGDRVRWLPDGSLDLLGRHDHQVKLRGYRVELEEVECAIGSHGDVRECAAAVRRDARGERLEAYVVPRSAAPAGASEALGASLRAHLASRLPAYMIPAAIRCVTELPKNAHGKLDRSALLALPSDGEAPVAPADLPASPAEVAIAAIWRELLGRDRIGLDDNFYDLGGHSLMAIEVFHRLRAALAPTIRLVDLFQYPTVRTLAAFVSPPAEPVAPSSVPADAATARARRQALGGRRRAARVS